MKGNYLLRITDKENNDFGFIVDTIYEVSDTDIPITFEDYQKFFYLQGQGRQFKLKAAPTGNRGLFDYVEEFKPKPIKVEKSQIEIIKEENLKLKLSLAEMAEKNEKDKLEMQLALAELTELLSGGGNL